MAHVLFAAHPSVGHTQAVRAIGRELSERGHTITFAMVRLSQQAVWQPMPSGMRSVGGLLSEIERDGFEQLALPASLRSAYAIRRIVSTRGYDELDWAIELFTCDLSTSTRRLLEAIERKRPAIVIADCFFYAAWLAAEYAAIPYVSVYQSAMYFPVEGEPPFGSGLPRNSSRESWRTAERRVAAVSRRVDQRIAVERAALGLPAVAPGVLLRPYASALNVITSFPEFELPRPALSRSAAGPILWSGPCLGPRGGDAGGDFPWERLEGELPIVYIALGAVFDGQPEVYATLLEAVHRAGARAIVAAGAMYKAVVGLASAEDVVVRYAPQVALLARVDAVIGHGGNNSTNECLRAGKPVLVVPSGAEHMANGERVVRRGAGRVLVPESLTVEQAHEVLAELLSAKVRFVAKTVAESVSREDGTPIVADAVESVLRTMSGRR